eukprot:UN09838
MISALEEHISHAVSPNDIEVTVTTSDGVATIIWSVYDADAVAIMQDSAFQQEFSQTFARNFWSGRLTWAPYIRLLLTPLRHCLRRCPIRICSCRRDDEPKFQRSPRCRRRWFT